MNLQFAVTYLNKFYTWWTIAEPDNPSVEEHYTWEVNARINAPVRYWIRGDLTQFISKYLVRPFIDGYLWFNFRFNPKHQLHIIRPSTLKPGLHSCSDRILHSSMELFREFYEIQDQKDYSHTYEMMQVWREFTEINDWWKNYQDREILLPELPKQPDDWSWEMIFLDDYKDSEYAIELSKINKIWKDQINTWQNEEQEYLIKLMKLRDYLLT